jgi:hypothetical protein
VDAGLILMFLFLAAALLRPGHKRFSRFRRPGLAKAAP